MTIFDYSAEDRIGVVEAVDTATVVVQVDNEEQLRGVQVNQLLILRSSRVGQHLVAIVAKILRKGVIDEQSETGGNEIAIENIIRATLIGTNIDKHGSVENAFKRTLETVPEIGAECYLLQGERLTLFMTAISHLASESENPLSLGHYTLDEDALAYLDGNKFFQRHAVIVGSTGSGKSWTVARVIEQMAPLPSANALLFDIHGEYSPFAGGAFAHIKVAGPGDIPSEGVAFLPHWLLTYEEMLALLLDRTDNNAPNQAMAFSRAVLKAKAATLDKLDSKIPTTEFTIDSPIPYSIVDVIESIQQLDAEMVEGASKGKQKQGPLHGKLTRFIQRLNAKRDDKRLNFLFNDSPELMQYDWLNEFGKRLLHCSSQGTPGIKIIDFSEVPSDILPLIISLVARLVFTIQLWTPRAKSHPVAIFCDEAHLYISDKPTTAIDSAAGSSFERIAKEGRKYGVGLVVISQRPSEVNRTVLSQCNNYVAMRLTNAEDQSVIRRLLPDSLGGFSDLLPILDIGEAIVVGDASLLPSRIRILEPNTKPLSVTVPFWDRWSLEDVGDAISEAVEALRKQHK